MPLTKRSYSFHGKSGKRRILSDENAQADKPPAPTTTKNKSATLRKIKTRGKSFIGRKGNNGEGNTHCSTEDEPWSRGSVQLRSFRKRKMADRDDAHELTNSDKTKVIRMDKEVDIQRKIDDQIKMREGAMRLMSACGNIKQALDASKNLNAINARVLALMSALQKKRSSVVLKDYNKRTSIDVSVKACPARVGVSSIRIPLMWKDDAHFKERSGDPYLLYYMFCLLKMGDQVLDTPLQQIDHKDTDVIFEGPIVFENATADFKLDFEIYYTVIINPDKLYAATPMRTSRKGAATPTSIPKYCLAAHAQFDAKQISNSIVTSDLIMGGHGAHATAVLGQKDELPDNQLNLWGQVCLQLAAQPACMVSEKKRGSFYLQEANGAQPSWGKYDVILRGCSIECKRINGHNGKSTPNGQVDIKLKSNMHVTESKLNGLGKNHVLILESDGQEKEPVLGFDNAEDFHDWKVALEDSIVNAKAWGQACDSLMEFQSFHVKLLQSSPKLSLYDQILLTPTKESKPEANKVDRTPIPGEDIQSEDNEAVEETKEQSGTPMDTEEEKLSIEDDRSKTTSEQLPDVSTVQEKDILETDHVTKEELETNHKETDLASEKHDVDNSVVKEEQDGNLSEKVEAKQDLSSPENTRTVPCYDAEVPETETGQSKELVTVATEIDTSKEQSESSSSNVEEHETKERENSGASDELDDANKQGKMAAINGNGNGNDDKAIVSEEDTRERADTTSAMSAIAALDEALEIEEGAKIEVEESTPVCSDGHGCPPHTREDLGVLCSLADGRKEQNVLDSFGSTDDHQILSESKDRTNSAHADEDELLNQRLNSGEDEDELLNRKLGLYSGKESAKAPEDSMGVPAEESSEQRKPCIQTDI